MWPLLILGVGLVLTGCLNKRYPADTALVKYANRTTPGAKIDIKKHLVPDKMNLLYVFADG